MALLWDLFKKKPTEEDYETILSNLADDIQKRQQLLADIRLRERRATLLTTIYTLAAWLAYVAIWYMGVMDPTRGWSKASPGGGGGPVQRAIRGAPVLWGPIIILFIRRLVQLWFSRKGDTEEKTIRELLKTQRTKVEEIKKKTNYYSTRELLSRFDDGTSPSGTPQKNSPAHAGRGPRQSMVPPGAMPNTPQRPPNGGGIPQGQVPLSSPGVQPNTTPGRKQWFDRLADAVLGDDDSAQQQPRYALICEKCFTHNGLVKESVWDDTQYVCPKCGHLNLSRKAKTELQNQALLQPPPPPPPAGQPAQTEASVRRRSTRRGRSSSSDPSVDVEMDTT